jgi:hypothetical protein
MRSTRPLLLGVESLDDRLVPSATILDLTTAGATATLANAAVVQQTDAQPTGTGYIRSFVRVQGAASGGGIEQGYNTTARPLQFDENKSPQFTRELTLGQVPTVVLDGHAYREFLLDINQKSSARILSLDEVRLYLGGVSNLTGYDAADHTLAGLMALYDLDSAGDVSVKLDYSLNSGSGSGDMKLLIPAELFAQADPASFVYLYSKMGCQSGSTANAGFEEWAVSSAPSQIPGGTASLSGSVFFDSNQDGVFDVGFDHAIAGVVIHLRGVNDLGLTVDLTTTTGMDGSFSFTGLRTGTYTMWESQPDGYVDGNDYVGSAGGIEDNTEEGIFDLFRNIQLFDGQSGVNYIFTEKFSE